MNFSENKSICPLAWVHVAGHTDGSVRLCCVSSELITKEDGTNYNLGYDKIEDILNSNKYKQIRSNMIAGNRIEGCKQCYLSEDKTGFSYRLNYLNVWKRSNTFQRKYQQSLNNGNIEPTVQYYDLRYGNLCNLSCRSCYSEASSQFDKDVRNLKHTNIIKFHGVNDRDVNSWYETNTFEENVNSQLSNMTDYYCTGGEPTLIDKNYEILTRMIETGDSKHITLKFNTNLTNTKKDFYSLFKHFKHVRAMLSVDGTKELQEYLRFPSDWNQISKNLQKLVDMDLSTMTLVMTPVIQKTNINLITDLFEYVESINRVAKKSKVHLSPIICVDPPHLDLNYLPIDYKIKCWEKIDNWVKNNCKYQTFFFHDILSAVKTKCYTDVEYKQNLSDFFEFNDIFDIHRNESLMKINPDLANLRDK